MDIGKINIESGRLIVILNETELKPDEKIAALESAAATIRCVLAAESLRIMWATVFEKMGK